MIKIIFFAVVQLPLILFAQEDLQFMGEKIDFSLSKSQFTINGLYIFANNSDNEINQTIFFPFSENADSLVIKRVYNLTYNKNVSFQNRKNGMIFKLVLLPKDTVNINISYTQKTETENVYILESTKTWKKPLQFAEYSLTCDENVSLKHLSYQPDTIEDKVYYWCKTNFVPDEDFCISIE